MADETKPAAKDAFGHKSDKESNDDQTSTEVEQSGGGKNKGHDSDKDYSGDEDEHEVLENDPNHPYVGKRVKITSGARKGVVATVVNVRARGWLELDHPDTKQIAVPIRRCQFLDKATVAEMERYYEEVLDRPGTHVTPNMKHYLRGDSDNQEDEEVSSYLTEERKQGDGDNNDSERVIDQDPKTIRAKTQRTDGEVDPDQMTSTQNHMELDSDGDAEKDLPPHPYVGKRVKVKVGPQAGIKATVKSLKPGGYLFLDHPKATGRVHVHSCHFIDKITLEEMKEYFKQRGRSFKPTPHQELLILTSGDDEFEQMQPMNANIYRSTAAFYPHAGVALNEMVDSTQESFSKYTYANTVASNVQCRQPERLKFESRSRPKRVPRPLRPILLEPAKGKELPSSLRHLNADTKVDIFNRKTGKIMSGDEAIPVRDLPEALLFHSEYEPIVPSSAGNRKPSVSREGRSTAGVRISASVTPLDRTDVARNTEKNRMSVVMTGPYRGFAKLTSAPPVAGILKDVQGNVELDFPVVVDSSDIELLQASNERKLKLVSSSAGTVDDLIDAYQRVLASQFRNPIDRARDRITKLRATLSKEEHSLGLLLSRVYLEESSQREIAEIESRCGVVRAALKTAEEDLHKLQDSYSIARITAFRAFEIEEKLDKGTTKNVPPPKTDEGRAEKRPVNEDAYEPSAKAPRRSSSPTEAHVKKRPSDEEPCKHNPVAMEIEGVRNAQRSPSSTQIGAKISPAIPPVSEASKPSVMVIDEVRVRKKTRYRF